MKLSRHRPAFPVPSTGDHYPPSPYRPHRPSGVASACLLLLLLVVPLVGCQQKADKGDKSGEAGAAKPADASNGEKKGDEKKDDKKEEAPLPTVVVVTAHRGLVEKTLPVSGTLSVPREDEAVLTAPLAGVIEALPVRFGQSVSRGQVVVRLSTRTLAGQIAQARATIAQYTVLVQQAEANSLLQKGQSRAAVLQAGTAVSNARANLLAAEANLKGAEATLTGNQAALENARQTQERVRGLFGEGLVAKKDVEAADLAVRSAEAQVAAQKQTVAAQQDTVAAQRETVAGLEQAAQATGLGKIQNVVKEKDIAVARQQLANAQGALGTLEAQASLYTLRAPIGGTISAVNASLGESVDTTTKILTIDRMDRLQLQVAVPSASVGSVRPGQSLVFRVDAVPKETFHATVRTVGTQIDSTNSTLTVVADVDNSRHLLKNGLAARVGLVLARHESAILVPPDAVFYNTGSAGTEAHVLKIDKDNSVHSGTVTVGFSDDTGVEILSGVQPGERLVTTGGYGLPDGTKVKVAGEEEKDDAKGGDKADDKGTGKEKSDGKEADDKKSPAAGEAKDKKGKTP